MCKRNMFNDTTWSPLYKGIARTKNIFSMVYKKLNFKAQPYYKEDSNRYTGSYM